MSIIPNKLSHTAKNLQFSTTHTEM